MLEQLDLSRITFTRSIVHEQHRLTRLSRWFLTVCFFLFPVFYGCCIACLLGLFVSQMKSLDEQARIFVAVHALVWLIGFGLLSRFYHYHLFCSPALPQDLTMPLTTRQIFQKGVIQILKIVLCCMIPVALLWSAFLLGFDEWNIRLLKVVPLLVILQSALNLTIPLFIALFLYRFYLKVLIPAGIAGALAILVVGLRIVRTPHFDWVWQDVALRNPCVFASIKGFPGAWIADFFQASVHQLICTGLWITVILSGCLVATLSIAFMWFHYRIWLWFYRRRNFDMDPRQPPRWMTEGWKR